MGKLSIPIPFYGIRGNYVISIKYFYFICNRFSSNLLSTTSEVSLVRAPDNELCVLSRS